jgi:outer membrane protein
MTQAHTLIAAAALSLLAAGAQAADATPVGTSTVYLGGAYIDIHSSAAPLAGDANTPALPAPGAQIRVGDASTVGFGYTYRFMPTWSVELALGIPPTHKTYGQGLLEPVGELSSVKEESPTVFFNYHLGPFGAFEPFVGLGINYTHFTDMHSTAQGDAASGGPTHIALSNSWGLAGHVGGIYHIDQHWEVVGTAAYADVRSDLTATTDRGNSPAWVRTTRIKFNPVVYTLSVGYNF